MTMVLIAAVAVLAVALVIALVMLMRNSNGAHQLMHFAELGERLEAASAVQARSTERLERELRNEISETARVSRTELSGGFSQFQQTLASQFT
jgi:DNA recombination protein RmuC